MVRDGIVREEDAVSSPKGLVIKTVGDSYLAVTVRISGTITGSAVRADIREMARQATLPRIQPATRQDHRLLEMEKLR